MKILIVDDETLIREVIKEYAENQIALTDLSNDEGTCGYVI